MLDKLRAIADENLKDLVADEAMRNRILAVCGAQSLLPRRANGALSASVASILAMAVMVVLLLATPAPHEADGDQPASMLDVLTHQIMRVDRVSASPSNSPAAIIGESILALPGADVTVDPQTPDAGIQETLLAKGPAESNVSPTAGVAVEPSPTPAPTQTPLPAETSENGNAEPSDTTLAANIVAPVASMVAQPLYPIRMEGKYGYMNATGEIKIEPRYDTAQFFSNNSLTVAGVSENGQTTYALIFDDATSTDCAFLAVGTFDGDDLAPAQDAETGLWGYINPNGQWLISPQYEAASAFQEDRAVVSMDGMLGSVSREGTFENQEEAPLPVVSATLMPESLIQAMDIIGASPIVRDGTRWIIQVSGDPALYGAMDDTGALIVPPMYASLAFLPTGGYIYGVPADNGLLYGILATDGAALASHEYAYLIPCPGDFAVIAQPAGETLLGLMGYDGQWILPPEYTAIQYFDGALALVEIMGESGVKTTGYVDTQGNWIRVEN